LNDSMGIVIRELNLHGDFLIDQNYHSPA
jgi:hypothetical protein